MSAVYPAAYGHDSCGDGLGLCDHAWAIRTDPRFFRHGPWLRHVDPCGGRRLLHIQPGDPGYGSPVLGMHLYSWSVVVFLVVLVVSGLMLVFGRSPILHAPGDDMDGSAVRSDKRVVRLQWFSWLTFGFFAAIILINVFATFAESGFHFFLPDNPTGYRLFEEQ